MKTIVSMNEVELLGAAYDLADAVEKFMKTTDLASIRKNLPEIPEDATDKEKEALYKVQWKKNVKAMFHRCMKEQPEATCELLHCLVIPEHKKVIVEDEDGEEIEKELPELESLTGLDYLSALSEIISAPGLIDTFFKLVKSALENFGD